MGRTLCPRSKPLGSRCWATRKTKGWSFLPEETINSRVNGLLRRRLKKLGNYKKGTVVLCIIGAILVTDVCCRWCLVSPPPQDGFLGHTQEFCVLCCERMTEKPERWGSWGQRDAGLMNGIPHLRLFFSWGPGRPIPSVGHHTRYLWAQENIWNWKCISLKANPKTEVNKNLVCKTWRDDPFFHC